MNMPRYRLAFAGLLFAIGLVTSAGAEEVFTSAYVSELLMDNRSGLKDDDGVRSPWIELGNAGRSPVNLAGWFLTDTPTNLTKWRFPGVVLLPEKFIVVFASGKDRAKDLAHLHTNFRLSREGNYLALVNPATNIVNELQCPAQSDVSFGSLRGQPFMRAAFQRPTPGRPNVASGPSFSTDVTFSRPGGTFIEPFTLALSSQSTGAVIRYSLDGSLPNTNSPLYEAPLIITNTTHLRARVYQPGLLPGPPHSEAYLKLSTNVVGFTSSLPLLVMETFGKDAPVSTHEWFAHLSFFEPVNGRASLTNQPTLATRAAHHQRGSTSGGMPQAGFALDLVDEFNEPKARALLGMPSDSDWILYAPNGYDPVLFHNPFIHQLSRDMGRYSPRTRFVEAFVVRSAGSVREAHYQGLYVLEEKIKIGKERVNLDRLDGDDLKPPRVTGGYMMKFDRLGPGESGFAASGDRGLVYVEPKEQTILLPQRAPQREYLQSFFADFDRALRGPQWKDPAAGYRAFLDVEAAIDFHVLEVLSGNVDAMVLSTYFHKPRGGKIVCGPHWDFDRALGSLDPRDENPRVWETGPFFGGIWWPRLFSDPDFWQAWVDRWQELRGNHFSLTNMNRLIDQLAEEVRDAQPRQYVRWAFTPRGGSYQSEIALMKSWLSNRMDFIDGQLAQPPRLNHTGGRVPKDFLLTLRASNLSTNGTIYYSLDGSDPRLSQGAVSTNAIRYTTPIPVPSATRVVARVHDPARRQEGGPQSSTPWSAPARATFETVAP
jgi:hypothetical protein